MKIRNGWMFAGIAFVVACCAVGEVYLRMPIREKKRCIEVVQVKEHFSEGNLIFRKQDKKSKTVFSVYETQMMANEVILQMKFSLMKDGWREVFETASMVVFENSRGHCAVINAYVSENGNTRASLLMQQ